MPLLKLVTTPNGAVTNYHKISCVEGSLLGVDEVLMATVHSWASEESHDALEGRNQLWTWYLPIPFSLLGGNMLESCESALLSAAGVPETPFVGGSQLPLGDTLEKQKARRWSQIKQARSQAEYAGFAWDSSTFDSDAISQNRITGAVTLAILSAGFTIDWTLQNNSVRTLNQTDMMQVGGALGLHVAAQFSKAQGLRAQIEAATTIEEVEAIVW